MVATPAANRPRGKERRAMPQTVLIVGAGAGLSAAVARSCARGGGRVALAARNPDKRKALAAELDARTYACDVADRAAVDAMAARVTAELGLPDVVMFNPSARVRGPFAGLDPEAVKQALLVTCYGGYLLCNALVPPMAARGSEIGGAASRERGCQDV